MNKKLLLPLLLVVVILASCQQSGYKIKGKIDNPKANEFSSAYLKEVIDGETKVIDSTTVEDGTFEFSGTVAEAKVVYISIESKGAKNKITGNLVLENKNLSVLVDSNYTLSISGSKNNEVLTKYSQEERRLENESENLVKDYRKKYGRKMSDELQAELSNNLQGLYAEYKDLGFNYASKHVNTLAGTHIFLNRHWDMDLGEKEAILKLMNDKTKEIANVAKIIQAVENEKKSAVGQQYLDFTLSNTEGEMVSLSDYVGNSDYLLIDFWASWCNPCLKSFPELVKFYEENKGDNKLDILGVSLDKKEDDWLNAIERYELNWNHMSDLAFWDSEAAKLYAVNSIPATVLINKEGVIVGRNLSFEEIQDLLNQ